MQTRLALCSIVVAVVGVCSAALIYLTAAEDSTDEGYQYVMIDGKVYPIPLADTKMYRRDVQRFGGKAALLFDDFNRWFVGLWHGRSLAATLVWITGFLSLGLFLLARQMPPDAVADARSEDPPRK